MLKTIYSALLCACLLCFYTKGFADATYCQTYWPQITNTTDLLNQFSQTTDYLINKPMSITNSTLEDLTVKSNGYITIQSMDSNPSYVIPAGQTRTFRYHYAPEGLKDFYYKCNEWDDNATINLQFPSYDINFKGKTESCTVHAHNDIDKWNYNRTPNWVDVFFYIHQGAYPSPLTYPSKAFNNVAQSQYTHFSGKALESDENQYIFHDQKAASSNPSIVQENLSLDITQCNDTKLNAIEITNNTNDTLSHFTAKDKSFISSSSKLFNDDSETISPMGSSDKAMTSNDYPTVIPYDALDKNGNWSFSYKDKNNNNHTITVGVKSDLDPIISGFYVTGSSFFNPPLYYRLDSSTQSLDSGYPASITSGYKSLLSVIGNHNVLAILGTSSDNKGEKFILDNNTTVYFDEHTQTTTVQQLPIEVLRLMGHNKIVAAATDYEQYYYFLDNNTYIATDTHDQDAQLRSFAVWKGLSAAVGTNKILTAFYDPANQKFYFFLNNSTYLRSSETGVEYTEDDFKLGYWPAIDLAYQKDQKEYTYKFYANKSKIYAMVFKKASPELSKKKNNIKGQLYKNKGLKLTSRPVSAQEYVFYKSGRYAILKKDVYDNFSMMPGYPKPISELFPSIPQDQIKNIQSVVFDTNMGNLNVYLNNGTVYAGVTPHVNTPQYPIADNQFYSSFVGPVSTIQSVTSMFDFPGNTGIFSGLNSDSESHFQWYTNRSPRQEQHFMRIDYLSNKQSVISGPDGHSLVAPATGKIMDGEEEAIYFYHDDSYYLSKTKPQFEKLSDLFSGIYLFKPTITCKDSAAINPDTCTASVTNNSKGKTFGIAINSASHQTKH